MDKNVLAIKRACQTDVRRALSDFALLSILIYLFLAFLHPEKLYSYIYLSFPNLVVIILSKSKKDFVYPFAITLALISIVVGIMQDIYPVSLKEWGIFFELGYSLHFSELADLLLLLNFVGIIFFSVRGIILRRDIE